MERQTGPQEDRNTDHALLHRGVADDLLIIAGLFDIRMTQISNEDALSVLRELHTLTKVMAIVHGTMYSAGVSDTVGARILFEKIVKSVRLTHCTRTRISATMDCGERVVPGELAVPCAFVLAECVRHSILRSFEDCAEGRIEISYDGPGADGWYTLSVTDNGFPEYATVREEERDEAIRIPVAEHIVRYRLKGTVTRTEEEGMAWTIRFPGSTHPFGNR